MGIASTERLLSEVDDQGKEWLRRALGLGEDQDPFPWQLDLLRSFCRGDDVQALDIPTGLGKTATIAVWLVARALGAKLPRRLVHVGDDDRRTRCGDEGAESGVADLLSE